MIILLFENKEKNSSLVVAVERLAILFNSFQLMHVVFLLTEFLKQNTAESHLSNLTMATGYFVPHICFPFSVSMLPYKGYLRRSDQEN